jgi:hypothetical protein
VVKNAETSIKDKDFGNDQVLEIIHVFSFKVLDYLDFMFFVLFC